MIELHLIGDSLVTAYGSDNDNFIGGWGDHLASYFDKDIHINCYAQGGRSTRSFLNEGRFIDTGIFTTNDIPYGMGPVLNRIKKGDYVFIEFGHNDDNSKSKCTYIDRITPLGTPDANGIYPVVVPIENMRTTTSKVPDDYEKVLEEDGLTYEEIELNRKKYKEILPTYGKKYFAYNCGATYKGYLKYYIDKVRELGAIPVLVTPVSRLYFKDNKIIPTPGHHGNADKFGAFPYVRAMKQLANEEKVALIDLFSETVKILEMLGEEYSLYLQNLKDEDGKTIGEARHQRPKHWVWEYDEYIEKKLYGSIDRTHQNRFGSYLFAGKVAELIYMNSNNTSYNTNSNTNINDFSNDMNDNIVEDIDTNLQRLKCHVLSQSSKKLQSPKKLTGKLEEIIKMYQYAKPNII